MKNLDTILVIDDDKMIRRILRDHFEAYDCFIMEATNAKRSLDILDQHIVHAILLDQYLPDGLGVDFIKKIKQKTNVPLIMISGEDDNKTKIKSLENGADDYVTKPFNISVLFARVQAHIRRHENNNLNQNFPIESQTKTFKDWTLSQENFQAFNTSGQSADLTPKEFHLLNFMISNPNRVLKRDELCQAIRNEKYIPTHRAIDVKITRIRKKIGDPCHASQTIKTIRGIGYLFSNDL